jgi:hypothetical protein
MVGAAGPVGVRGVGMTPDQVHDAALNTVGVVLTVAISTYLTLAVGSDRATSRTRGQLIDHLAEKLERDIEENERHRRKIWSAALGPHPFTAFCDCPKCSHFACHWLRVPVPIPSRAPDPDRVIPARTTRTEDGKWVIQFEEFPHATRQASLGWINPIDPERLIAAAYPERALRGDVQVIRTCTQCQHEWGQI